MEALYNSEKKINKNAYGIAAGIAGLLVSVLLISNFTKQKVEPVHKLVEMQIVEGPAALDEINEQSVNGILKQRFYQLQLRLQQYNTAAAAGKDKAALKNAGTTILLAEEAFKSYIDSSWSAAFANKNTNSSHLKTIAAYMISLDSLRKVNSILNMDTAVDDFVPDRKAFTQLWDELVNKTNRIALLESSMELMSKQAVTNTSGKSTDRNNDIQLADVVLLENKVNELTTGNQRLQQEVDRLRKLTVAIEKNNAAEDLLLSKNTALQQKVNLVTAEMQLVKVDCNLSRVDATQIISNSKQRKQLLSEASGILTNLSTSSDAVIRDKVKEKIVRLNQIAAITRD